MTLEDNYDPLDVESGWYEYWQENGYFHADEDSDREPFTIVIPPPNVTGSLHMGHALFVTLQDILTRWKRMEGYEALWLPGTDHAGIATQVMVEKQLAEEGTDRHELGREKFVERAWEWKDEQGGKILEQLKRMGASCDWERERFTLDEGLNRAVREAFVQLYEDGLIFRKDRMVNWDPEGQTVLSDLEVEHEEEEGKFWYLRYPLSDGSDEIVVATTRPETMLGDTAVAVHPDDDRYAKHIGKTVDLPIVGKQIPVVADEVLPDPETGTGAVKVTPAHDPDDYDCGQRHDLEVIQVIDFDANINENAPEAFHGLDRYEARQKVVDEFEKLGLLEKVEERPYSPGRSERTGVVVEPLPMKQWFVDTEPLAKKAIDAVESGDTKIIPELWKKTYDHFMYNIRDWCISRQLWWGHQIPAWYCNDCDEITVARTDPDQCDGCGSSDIYQDDDVLDTWFSSALWPFSTMGWPEQTKTLDKFYPTQVMETGSDILFFWVARMMMMGLWFMDEVPFEEVYLHAMVRDADGNKMSKTKGNVIDPLHMIRGADPKDLDEETHAELLKQYPEGIDAQGTDSLRFTLATYAAQGRDIKLDIQQIEGYRAFMNKLWNASKFTLMNLEDFEAPDYDVYSPSGDKHLPVPEGELSMADKWILTRLNESVRDAKNALDDFHFDDYTQGLYEFVWQQFCDWYIELSKNALYDQDDQQTSNAARQTLNLVLEHTLRLLHPVIPYVTEEIWHSLPLGDDAPDSIMVAPWPEKRESLAFEESADAMDRIIGVIGEIRGIRGETNVKPGDIIDEVYLIADRRLHDDIRRGTSYIKRLANVDKVTIQEPGHADKDGQMATAVFDEVDIQIPLKGLIDIKEERKRLNKELERVHEDIDYVEGKLDNDGFVNNAPEDIVEKERQKLENYREEKQTLESSLEELEQLEA